MAHATLGSLEAAGLGRVAHGEPMTVLNGVRHDSRRVTKGDLFVAVSGEKHDGAAFARDAESLGASAVMAERVLDVSIPQIIVADARRALPKAAELVYGAPTSALELVGITGTNGKTTTAYLVAEILRACGKRPATLGTTGFHFGDRDDPQSHTTPEADDISRYAREALDAGATHFVLEASSHGLSLGRVDALDFDVAAFTNLSRDHLDYHKTFDEYGAAKSRLFTELEPKACVVNVDDEYGAALARELGARAIRCTRRGDVDAEVRATEWTSDRGGIRAEVDTPRGALSVKSPMCGEHNLENILVALGCTAALELDLGLAAQGLADAVGSPGRLERVSDPRGVAVFVDYAHTPDALERVLNALRPLTPGRLMVVFGAGGDRDRAKRPQMGAAAASNADVVVITNDNPRSEEAQLIAEDVAAGAVRAGGRQRTRDSLASENGFAVVLDRGSAIQLAIEIAAPGDTVLLAGKGHETVQIIGDKKIPFSDREQAQRVIAAMGAG